MNPVYLGVDVAGAKNTWMMSLSPSSHGLAGVDGPEASLAAVVGYCEGNNVVAATIDAQLTAALSEENSFRESDTELRDMLLERQGSRNWVASAAGLLAVPVRGRLLAEHLSPTVGTVIETHPRASLLFALGEEFLVPIWEYKRGDEASKTHTRALWRAWSEAFGILPHEPVYHDGALDSLMCATVAHLYHHTPAALHKLRHEVAGRVGRGPFYVVPQTRARTVTVVSRPCVPGRLERKLLKTVSSVRTTR